MAQHGAPLELYRRPRNRFVAGFLGSPRMNFLPGRLAKIEPRRAVVTLPSGANIRVAADASAAAEGATVTLGIRPEQLRLGDPVESRLEGSVSLVERLGDHALVYVEWLRDEPPVVVRTAGEGTPSTGQRCSVGLAPDRCHLFDAAGEAFPVPAPAP